MTPIPGALEAATGTAAKVAIGEATKRGIRYGPGFLKRLWGAGRRNQQAAALAHRTNEAVRTATTLVASRDFTSGDARELRGRDLMDALRPLLGALSAYFQDHFTKRPTATCIKLLLEPGKARSLTMQEVHPPTGGRKPPPEEPLVLTLVRDAGSDQHRDSRPYYVYDCTAFEEIMRHDRFMFRPKDDLRQLHECGGYRNPTPNFWRHYRSTMVLPIRAPRQAGATPSYLLTGFLCLDCQDPGRFKGEFTRAPRHEDNPEDFNIAAMVSDALFWPLFMFSWRLQNPGPPPMPFGDARLLEE